MNTKRMVLASLAVLLAGCGTSVVGSAEARSTAVSVQLMGAGEWWATAVVSTPAGDIEGHYKPTSDTAPMDLGMVEVGSRFTMRTSVGRVEYARTPDSVRIVIGCDTLVKYGLEALEAVYVVE